VYFLRRDNESVTGFISEIKPHPTEDNILLFVVKSEEMFSIAEVNIVNLSESYKENMDELSL
jgi:hypothetical protein